PPTGPFPTMTCRVLRRFASVRGGLSRIPRSTVVTLDSPRLPPKEGGDGFSSVSEWGRTFASFRCRALDRPHSRRPQLHRRVRNASPRLRSEERRVGQGWRRAESRTESRRG